MNRHQGLPLLTPAFFHFRDIILPSKQDPPQALGLENSVRTRIRASLVLGICTTAFFPGIPLRLLAQSTAKIDDAVLGEPSPNKALYVSDVAEIERVVKGVKAEPIVLYCNGPFCGKSKRVSEDLLSA